MRALPDNAPKYGEHVRVVENSLLTSLNDDNFYDCFSLPNNLSGLIISSQNCKSQNRDKIVFSVLAGSVFEHEQMNAGLAHLTSKYVMSLPSFVQFVAKNEIQLRTSTQLEFSSFELDMPIGNLPQVLAPFAACFTETRSLPTHQWLQQTLSELAHKFDYNLATNSLFCLSHTFSQLVQSNHPFHQFPHAGRMQVSALDSFFDQLACQVHNFFVTNYQPHRIRFLVRSSVPTQQVQLLIQKHLTDFPSFLLLPSQTLNDDSCESYDSSLSDQSEVCVLASSDSERSLQLPCIDASIQNCLFVIPLFAQTNQDVANCSLFNEVQFQQSIQFEEEHSSLGEFSNKTFLVDRFST